MFYGTQDMTWHVVNLGFGGFREDFMMSLLYGLTVSYNQKGNEYASKFLLPELLLQIIAGQLSVDVKTATIYLKFGGIASQKAFLAKI